MVKLEPVDGTDIYIWKYLPSIPAAIIFIVLFTGVTSANCWRMVNTRSWFCSAFAVGGLFQMIGYPARVFAHYHTDQIGPYAVQSSFILLAPVFYAASIYMVLGRLRRALLHLPPFLDEQAIYFMRSPCAKRAGHRWWVHDICEYSRIGEIYSHRGPVYPGGRFWILRCFCVIILHEDAERSCQGVRVEAKCPLETRIEDALRL
ncbi:hypothetical protein V1509DRAFT_670428 [Lipomyces kononenkoae]